MRGVIRSARYFQGRKEYVFTDGRSRYRFHSDDDLVPGSFVEIQGDIRGDSIIPTIVIVLEGKEAEEAERLVKENVKDEMKATGPSIVRDEITERMWPMLSEAALEILVAKRTGRQVFLRFHGDADGICGAFAISKVVRCKTFQQNAAIYGVRDALRDIGNVGQEPRPLLILLDFGSSDASQGGLNLLDAAGIHYMVIDHHPPGKNPPERMINPFSFSQDGSKYTAGYLACEMAVACGMELEEAKGLAKIACAGDKSGILPCEDQVNSARVLDFLAAHISFGNNLEFYKKVMEKEELFKSISIQAEESIGEAAAKAKIKETKEGDLRIVTFALETIVKKGEWPPAGKITTKIFEDMKEGGPLVVVGHTERSLIIRLNEGAEKLGIDANGLAKEMMAIMPDFIDGGGGHTRAGALRVKQGFAKDVLGQLTDTIKEKIKKIS